MPENINADVIDQEIFEAMCDVHPHEMAEYDWKRFFAYSCKRAAEVGAATPTEEYVRQCLKETEAA